MQRGLGEGLCAEHRDSPLETLRERTCLDAVAHGGNPRMKALHRSFMV